MYYLSFTFMFGQPMSNNVEPMTVKEKSMDWYKKNETRTLGKEP